MATATQLNPATQAMLKTIKKILDCWEYEDGWDEDFVTEVQKQSNRSDNWAKAWYLADIKEDGGFNFSGIGVSFHFAEWAAKEALKEVDWIIVGQKILERINKNS